MRRSAGVTISAVIVLVGSAFTLLYGMLAAIGALVMFVARDGQRMGGIFAATGAIFVLGFGVWGLATGIGLIQAREWARVSILVYSALLVVGALFMEVIFALLPFGNIATAQGAEDVTQFLHVMRAAVGTFFGAAVALGVWWFYFFMKAKTREQFAARRAPMAPVLATAGTGLYAPQAGTHPLPGIYAEPPMRRLGRPVSITVIAALFLIGACYAPLSILQMHVMFPGLEMPVFLFGKMITGGAATSVFFFLLALRATAGVGLLKLRPWARILAIAMVVFGLLNTAVSFGLPSGRAAFGEWMAAMMKANFDRMNLPPNARMAIPFTMFGSLLIIGALLGLIVYGVILWFLIEEKDAFYRAKVASLSGT